MDSLPSELLTEIFLHCAVQEPLGPISLLQVSQLWHDIVQHSPRVWQSITLSDSRPLPSSWIHAEQFMTYSKPLEFRTHVSAEDSDIVLPLLSPLLPFMNRCSSLTIHTPREGNLVLNPSIMSEESFLKIAIDLVGPRPAIVANGGMPHSPELQVNPEDASLTHRVTILPNASLFPNPLKLTHLTITESSRGRRTLAETILHFLTACPQLQVFSYRGSKEDDGLPSFPLPIVDLPHLTRMEIAHSCSIRTFLSCIHAPKLDTLHLDDLNVNFQFQADWNEDGDVMDDSGDFSHSPYSDYATGMGLRALISRSQPPLRVLRMDYADMRAKDFKYLFDRLTVLEEFSIRGSDMPDSVLETLRPFTITKPTMTTTTNPTESKTEQLLRLPKLQRLEMYECMRLSGYQIVRVLTDRVRLLDSDPPVGTSQLKNVVMVESGSMTASERSLLSYGLRQCSLQFN